jgi:Ran GTPase-activating protein (RanGAP) involved in mRNA processing and transport
MSGAYIVHRRTGFSNGAIAHIPKALFTASLKTEDKPPRPATVASRNRLESIPSERSRRHAISNDAIF